MSRLLSLATRLLTAADGDPLRVRRDAPATLDLARRAGDAAALAIALRALGVAERRLGENIGHSIACLEESVAVARPTGDTVLHGESLVSLAMSLAFAGRVGEAHEQLDRADFLLTGPLRARVAMQRATIGLREGEAEAAHRPLAAAIRELLDAGDLLWAAHGVGNRGLTLTYLGRVAAGIADLRWACDTYRQLGATYQWAVNLNNLGFALGRSGDLPGALELFDQAGAVLQRQGVPLAELPLDRAEVLLAAGLAADAQEIIARVVAELQATRMEADLADALLMQAQAALFARDLPTAIAVAGRAQDLFAAQDRPAWAAFAHYVEVAARFRSNDDSGADHSAASDVGVGDTLHHPNHASALLADARSLVGPLAAAGQATAHTHVLTMCGRLALSSGDLTAAEHFLGPLGRRRGSLPADLTIQIWLARALLHEARGDRSRALRAIRSGLAVGEEARRLLGATDLRSGLSLHLEELAEHGVRLAVEGGDPTQVLRWMDQARASSTDVRPARAPLDEELALLRTAQAELRNLDGEDPRSVQRRIAALERDVQSRDRATQTGALRPQPRGRHRPADRLDVGRLLTQLGPDRELVELGEVGGRLLAVVAGAGRCRLVELGPAAPLAAALASQRRAVDWVLAQDPPAGRWIERERTASETIDQHLLQPLGLTTDDVVLVPPTHYFGAAWAHLPSLKGRALTVAPSAMRWSRPQGTGARPADATPATPSCHQPRIVAVAGPDVGLAPAELDVIARLYGPDALVLPAREAATAAVLRAAAGADILHIAAHGHLPRGNGMFAGVDLADGRLMVYDIERLPAAPSLVVLSACDGATVDDRPGEEFLGLVAGFLAAGTTTLIAATGKIPDTPVLVDLIADLHRNLRAGASPARALADAQLSAATSGDHRATIIASSFLCLGADTKATATTMYPT